MEERTSFGDIGNSILDTLDSVINYGGNALDNAAANAASVVNINNAQANAISEASKRKTKLMEDITKIILVAVLAVTLVAVFSIASRKG